jgi:hypothetical protein
VRPGDRIFLIGFSRGAYTVRCLAGVIARCGIPVHPKTPNGILLTDPGSAQDGIKFDHRVISMWPHPEGPQHDEVASRFSFIPKWTGITWAKENRKLPASAATMHRSVYRRFDLAAVHVYDKMSRYRPETLSTHDDLKSFYAPAAPFPATSEQIATATAGEPPPLPRTGP